jgi:sigma-B regulation protein RsbU (phosphoserine phosphatase)
MSDKVAKDLEVQLKLKDFKLNSLLEITTAINSNQEVDQLIRIFEFILKEQLGFDKFILFNKQEDWIYLLKTGFKGKIKDIEVERDLYRFKDITVIESSPSSILNEFDVGDK